MDCSKYITLHSSALIIILVALSFVVSMAPSSAADQGAKLEITNSLGTLPSQCTHNSITDVKIIRHRKLDDADLFRVRFRNCVGQVSALLGAPPSADARTPVVVALPQTSKFGAAEIFGLGGDQALAFGRAFLRAGFVVVAPDTFLSGENYNPKQDWDTTSFYKKFPNWSAMGRMLVDNESVVNLLLKLGRKPSCIATVGHSLGGHNALFLAAFDKRINVVVSSGGFEMIATDDNAERWARRSWFVYMPALRPYVTGPAPHQVPWDFDDVIRAIFPRPVMIVHGGHDPIWTHANSVDDMARQMKSFYTKAGIAGEFEDYHFEGGHEFPVSAVIKSIRFIGKECGVSAQ